jgi:DNA-binding CsgD family transcriptional regulator
MVNISEINQYFRTIILSEYNDLTNQLLLSDFQETIFRLKYIDRMGSDDIANAMGIKLSKVNNELFIIRQKLSKLPIFTKEKFNPDTASEYAMRDKCRKCGFSAFMTNFCVDAFCIRLSNKELANKYNYSLATVKQYKTEKRKQLSK